MHVISAARTASDAAAAALAWQGSSAGRELGQHNN
jgi:hypothetical protein